MKTKSFSFSINFATVWSIIILLKAAGYLEWSWFWLTVPMACWILSWNILGRFIRTKWAKHKGKS
jgi:hypothetical protein